MGRSPKGARSDLRAEAESPRGGSPRDRRRGRFGVRVEECPPTGGHQSDRGPGGPDEHPEGRVFVLACKSKEQKEKLEQELRKREGVTVRDIPRMNPTLTLTGLEAHWSAEEVVANVHQKNDWLHGGQPLEEFRKSFAFLTKRKCQNERRQNMVFAVEPRIHHEAMERGKVVVGRTLCFVT
jgi:hypothetical protein